MAQAWISNNFVYDDLFSLEVSSDEEAKHSSEDVLRLDQGNTHLHVHFKPKRAVQPKFIISEDNGQVSESLINVVVKMLDYRLEGCKFTKVLILDVYCEYTLAEVV